MVEYYLNADGDIDTRYVENLESSLRSSGVEVPFTFNDVCLKALAPLIIRLAKRAV
jgi:hypothetical protein